MAKRIKKIAVLALALIILAIGVNAALNLYGDTATDLNITGDHGTNVSDSFKIENTGASNFSNTNLTATALASGSNAIGAGNVTFSRNNFVVENKTNQTVTVSVNIPARQYAGNYTGAITAAGSGSDSDSIVFNVIVNKKYDLTTPGVLSFGSYFQNESPSATFSITNNGNADLTSAAITTGAAGKYNISFNETSLFTLAVGQSRTVRVDAYIPRDESTGNKSIGAVNILTNENNFTSAFNIYLDVKSKLRISDLDVEVGGKTDSNLQNEGDDYKIGEKAKPEDNVEFRIKLKNDYTKTEDIDIENIAVTATIDGIDLGDDMEEESAEFDLDPTEDTTVTLTFEVPFKVDENEYDVEILVEGEDKTGIDYRIVKNFVLEVDKKSHEIFIHDAKLSPETYGCSREGTLDIKLMNIGGSNEDEAELEAKSSALGIDIRKKDIELDKDPEDDNNIHTEVVPINVPSNLAAGTYKIEIKAYYSGDVLDDYKQVDLVVKDCAAASEEEEEEEESVEVIQQPATAATGGEIAPVGVIPTATTEASFIASFIGSPAYLAVAALGALIIAGGAIAALAAKFLANKRQ